MTRFYLNNVAAAVTPSGVQGSWDDSASLVTKQIDLVKANTSATSVSVAETSASNTYRVALYRGVTPTIDAQTISGTIDVGIIVDEVTSAASDFYTSLHVYVMKPDGTVRGTLLANYSENTTNEWLFGGSSWGKHLQSAQTLSSVVASAGDRIVAEIGYIARNSVTTSFSGQLYYGGNAYNIDQSGTTGPVDTPPAFPWIEFSGAIAMEATGDLQLAQLAVEAAVSAASPNVRVSQVVAESLAYVASPAAQVSQVVVEVLLQPGVALGRSMVVIAG